MPINLGLRHNRLLRKQAAQMFEREDVAIV